MRLNDPRETERSSLYGAQLPCGICYQKVGQQALTNNMLIFRRGLDKFMRIMASTHKSCIYHLADHRDNMTLNLISGETVRVGCPLIPYLRVLLTGAVCLQEKIEMQALEKLHLKKRISKLTWP